MSTALRDLLTRKCDPLARLAWWAYDKLLDWIIPPHTTIVGPTDEWEKPTGTSAH